MELLVDNDELVSIIVPVYNSEKHLCHCLDSLLSQTWKKIEIILIDDGSSDRSPEICDEYAEKYNNIVVIHKINGGVSAARNLGLKLAKGKYIGFCDSDDLTIPEMYEILVKEIKETNAQISCCGYIVFKDEKSINLSEYEDIQIKKTLSSTDKYMSIIKNDQVRGYLWNKLFLREVIESSNRLRFQEDLAILEDEVFVLDYLKRCNSMVIVNTKGYLYRDNPMGAVNQLLNERQLTSVIGRERILKFMKKECVEEGFEVALTDLIKSYSITHKKLMISSFKIRNKWIKRIRKNFNLLKAEYSDDVKKVKYNLNFKERVYFFILLYFSELNN